MKTKPNTILVYLLLLFALLFTGFLLLPSDSGSDQLPKSGLHSMKKQTRHKVIRNSDTVRIRDYFRYMDSLVVAYDSVTDYTMSEQLLVRANPWIMDTLANTDYYRLMARDSFLYDQKQAIVFRPGDSLLLPDVETAAQLLEKMHATHIDVNIPEFKLRIYEDSTLLAIFPVRVGQNRQRYLKMGDRITDLRTKTGTGKIVEHRRNPAFYNPVNGKRFYLTKRDDNRITLMPQIPWIVTEINGIRNGQLIHPTTNPKSIGKASSNGCIGTRESDAWIIYYHAPIGTKIKIRYALKATDSLGSEQVLKDIYGYGLGTD